MRIAIVTDAWSPQINGVVSTLVATRQCLRNAGHEVEVVSAAGMKTFACPTYPDIRLACNPYRKVASILENLEPDCIHIATEGPIGLAARRHCLKHGLAFTSSYHTRFPEYVRARSLIPMTLTYRWLKWFHGPSKAVMVPTPGILRSLEKRGFRHLVLWGRGVDTGLFRPAQVDQTGIARPLYLYVGRIAVEKNVEDFLRLDLPGSKWVIGDGPMREELQRRYPGVRFLGARNNDELVPYYNCADVFVFPSRTDTFGLVMAEAMACGTPVAAYPVDGPLDVVSHGRSGVLDHDLERACLAARQLCRKAVRLHALQYSWSAATQQFLANLHLARTAQGGEAAQSSLA
ncbi:glycosyltransferase family 4 protein [Noviherbaspirillum autotrophicum]|uniref:GDP-mannose-dependent alpha-mannosyltransferase n=1 Tax=Noviherbaspirillum autotrophicum TaxID=709839 RepID=A0A0C2BS66_9BURK|nr:glycosyltransferase family 1 protein [Noviherbaspirillum autotrophicum]KIF81673.1 GDP-mannose-dependent alpha-mannosyltransferase [Noviherbaspirillum autotrophicum]KIF82034.1 GDP-mannose-dependent alpha-mannosyltransferase [Noviherbaspirillum autotrophicum]KIF84080.1 GDP-mannose-dependent alpha-mannosyltransferase [Noviherbaspirillum autotrophicum]